MTAHSLPASPAPFEGAQSVARQSRFHDCRVVEPALAAILLT